MLQKPAPWNVSPALIAPEARPLWRGLAFIAPLWGNTGGNGVLLGPSGAPLRSVSMTAGAAMVRRGTPYGAGVGISGASNLLQRDNFEAIVTSDGAGTGDLTIIVLANPIAEARFSFGLDQGSSADTEHLALLFNTASSLVTATSGSFTFMTRNANAGTNVSVASVVDGKYHLFGGRRSGQTVTAFVDGVIAGSSTNTIRDIAAGTLGLAIGQRAEAATNRIDTACNIVLAAAWNRALSDAEMRMLVRDPFIMFRPYPEWRGVWTPLGGDTVLSPSDLTLACAFETPAMLQTHSLSAADASLGTSFEASGFSQNHILNAAELVLAAGLEGAGFSQAHMLAALELNLAVLFDAAALAMSSAGAPGFRTRGISQARAVKIPEAGNRTAKPQNCGRYKSIME